MIRSNSLPFAILALCIGTSIVLADYLARKTARHVHMDDNNINKVRANDSEAFRYLIRKYKVMAFSVAISVLKDEYLAEEVVQDTFVISFKGLPSFTHQAKFSTWFYRIVTNVAFQRLKKLKTELVSFIEEYSQEVVDESILLSLQEEEQV